MPSHRSSSSARWPALVARSRAVDAMVARALRGRVIDPFTRRHVAALRAANAVLGVLLIVAAAYVFATGPRSTDGHAALPPTPPSPTATASLPSSSAPSTAPAPSSASAAPRTRCDRTGMHGAGGSMPVHICIPAIGVSADVMTLGLNADHTVEVPPLSEVGLAGWYKYSPAPGVVGPSIILGHIDSAQYGKGVFFDLGRLKSGDRMTLLRADGMVATFRVDKVEEYPKTDFPTQTVYGNTNGAAIRLITCGGRFDPAAGSYVDNIVAFGSLVSLTRV